MTVARVKVCGLTRHDDVAGCAALGVEAVGFNCWSGSPRHVALAALVELVPAASGEIVLVFVRSTVDDVRRTVDACASAAGRAPWVQLHGDEDPTPFRGIGAGVVPVLRVDRHHPGGEGPRSGRVLVDARSDAFGGTGAAVDDALLSRLTPVLPPEWSLAGGLTPENVEAIVRRHHPWGVDVASGVESSPGRKDHTRLRAFVEAVRRAESGSHSSQTHTPAAHAPGRTS